MRCKPLPRPMGCRVQTYLDKKTEGLLIGAGFHPPAQLIGFAGNPDSGTLRNLRFRQHQSAAFSNLFEVSGNSLSLTPHGWENDRHELGTEVSGLRHNVL